VAWAAFINTIEIGSFHRRDPAPSSTASLGRDPADHQRKRQSEPSLISEVVVAVADDKGVRSIADWSRLSRGFRIWHAPGETD
jgi:hypothetical protein